MAKTVKNAPRKARSQMAEVLHQFRKNKGAMLGGMLVLVIIFIAVFADFLLDYDTQVIGQNLAERLQSPNANHWFGTDELGRDIFCRILYGTRFSCSVGLVAVTIVSPRSVDGDVLSTTCFSMGLDKGLELINSMDGIYAYFITDDYELIYSDGAEAFIDEIKEK